MDEVPTKKRGRPRKADNDKGRHIKVWLSADLERRLQAQLVRPGETMPEAVRRLLQAATRED